MTEEDIIIIFLLIMVAVLFFRELKRQNEERDSAIMKDSKKASAIIDTQLKQMEFMKSLDGRVNKLGEIVEIMFKILEEEAKQKQNIKR